MYKCSKCGLAVIVTAKKVHKVCKCEAPVVAEAVAKVEGSGGVKG